MCSSDLSVSSTATQFGIDGVAVELTEGSPIARVEFDSLLLADGPEMRDGHMALTRADAQAIERRVNQVLADWSVHRRFGSRITASRAAGDEAQLTMDGFQVVLRHDRPEATIAGQPVVITPAPRRALGNMTLAPSAFIALEQALSSARRAAQPPTSAWPDEPAISPPEGSLFSRHRSGLFGGQATSDFGLKPFGTTF